MDIITGETVATFPSILEAKRQTGVDQKTIRESAKGIYKRPYKGKKYAWRYANVNE